MCPLPHLNPICAPWASMYNLAFLLIYMFAHAVHPNWKKIFTYSSQRLNCTLPHHFCRNDVDTHIYLEHKFWPDIPQAPCRLGKQMKCPPVTIDRRTGPQYFIKWYAYISRELVRPAENCG